MVEAHPIEETNYTYIYVCGKTQGGKSTLIRRLTENEGVATGDGRASCTKVVNEYQCTGADQDVVCVDSPGLFDSGGADAEDALMSNIAGRMKHKPVSLFCFVVQRGVFSAEQMVTIRRIRYMFSQDKANWGRFCFIVTHCDFHEDHPCDDPTAEFRNQMKEEAERFAAQVAEQFATQSANQEE